MFPLLTVGIFSINKVMDSLQSGPSDASSTHLVPYIVITILLILFPIL